MSVFLSVLTVFSDEVSKVPLNVTDGLLSNVNPSFAVRTMVAVYVLPPTNVVLFGLQETEGVVEESDDDGVTAVTEAVEDGFAPDAGAVSEMVRLEMVPFVSANSCSTTSFVLSVVVGVYDLLVFAESVTFAEIDDEVGNLYPVAHVMIIFAVYLLFALKVSELVNFVELRDHSTEPLKVISLDESLFNFPLTVTVLDGVAPTVGTVKFVILTTVIFAFPVSTGP